MMRVYCHWATLLTLALAGCSSASSPAGSAADETPAQAVHKFLEAVRTGDQKLADTMLTKVAREKTAEMDLVMAPSGSDSASFKIGQVENVAPNVAHVDTFWTDMGEEGKPHTDEVIWFVRKDPEGWRIHGMATRVFDKQIPIVLNFEDPEDMVRKQEAAEKEMARLSGDTLQAGKPKPEQSRK